MESELYKSIFSKDEAKGKAEAYAEMLVRLLIHRIGTLDPGVRERIRAVSDMETLKAWHDEALFATDADAARRLVDKIQRI
jgi:hypothetical protein